MTVKELVSLFSSNIEYRIVNICNPYLVYWYGKGNKTNMPDNDQIIKAIDYSHKKGIIIYV